MNSHVETVIKPTSVRLHTFLALGSKDTNLKLKKLHQAFTLATRKESITGEPNKSAITDHVMDTNYVIGWKEASIKEQEQEHSRDK